MRKCKRCRTTDVKQTGEWKETQGVDQVTHGVYYRCQRCGLGWQEEVEE